MHIRGEKNTNVHITLERNGKWLEKDIQRQDYVLKTVEDQILDGNVSSVVASSTTQQSLWLDWLFKNTQL